MQKITRLSLLVQLIFLINVSSAKEYLSNTIVRQNSTGSNNEPHSLILSPGPEHSLKLTFKADGLYCELGEKTYKIWGDDSTINSLSIEYNKIPILFDYNHDGKNDIAITIHFPGGPYLVFFLISEAKTKSYILCSFISQYMEYKADKGLLLLHNSYYAGHWAYAQETSYHFFTGQECPEIASLSYTHYYGRLLVKRDARTKQVPLNRNAWLRKPLKNIAIEEVSIEHVMSFWKPTKSRVEAIAVGIDSAKSLPIFINTMSHENLNLIAEQVTNKRLKKRIKTLARDTTKVAMKNYRFYRVQKGDTLKKIAKMHHISLESLMSLNDLGPNTIIYFDESLVLSVQ